MEWAQLEARTFWLVMAVSFLVVAMWESLRPHRVLSICGERRWTRHGALLILSSVTSVGIYRIGPVVVAAAMAQSRFGLFHLIILPYSARFILTILLLDFAQYAVHWAEHHVPILWRMHQVHHSDPDFDLSTGVRVHPIEAVLVQGATLAAVALLAPPIAAVLAVELVACFQSFFAHANVALPVWLEKNLRRILVTPQMHRIHHSEDIREQSRNLADILPWWDHLFRTYLATPATGDAGVVIGMRGFQNSGSLDIWFMLSQPFRRERQELAEPPGAAQESLTR